MNRRQFLTGSAAAAGLAVLRPPMAWAAHGGRPALGGVCTHVLNKAQYVDTERVARHLRGLKTRLARDEWCPPGTGFDGFARRLEAVRRIHPTLRWIFVTGRAVEPIEPVLAQMAPYRDLLAGIEGPNEWNLSGREAWKQELSDYTKELYARVKAHPVLGDVPVLGPALAYPKGSGPYFGDHSTSMDVGTVHIYQPAYQVDTRYVQACIDGARAVSGTKTLWATELGAQIGDEVTRSDGYKPTENDQAWCFDVLRAEVGRRGVHRGFCYQLCNWVKRYESETTRENQFGCFRRDWSRKPLADRVVAANRAG